MKEKQLITQTGTEDPVTQDVPRKRLNDMIGGRIYQGEEPLGQGHSSGADESRAWPAPTGAGDAPKDMDDGETPGADAPAGDEVTNDDADPETDTPAESDDKPVYPRHKTLEAAEKSYAHAQSKLSKVTEENARLKQALEAREKALSETREKETVAAREAFSTSRYEQAMTALQELDEYDPGYKTAAAKIWADCHRDVAAFTTAPPATSPMGEPSSAPADDPAASVVPAAGPAAVEAGPDPEEIRAKIGGRMKDSGVSESEFGMDDPVFFGYASKAPTVADDGAALSFEDQVDWAIEQTRGHYKRVRSKLLQTAGQPMGRAGVAVRTGNGQAAASPKRVTLNGLLESSLARRTL